MADIIFPGDTVSNEVGSTWMPQNVDLRIWQGDRQLFYVKLTDANGAAISLTGLVFEAVLRSLPGTGATYSFTCTIEADPAGGQRIKVYMSSAVSTTIPAGSYVWNFQQREPGGDVRTFLAGDVEILAQVD